MTSFIEVKEMLLEIGTKKRPINLVRYFVGMIVSIVLFITILSILQFMVKKYIYFKWSDFILVLVSMFLIGITIIFYMYGLFRYGISKNK